MTIETKRLLLSEITLNDTEAMYAIYSNPKVIEYYTDAPLAGEEDAVNFISRITAGENIICGIHLKETPNTIIGDCALHDWNHDTNSVEIGGSLLPELWGKGIIAEAFQALINYAEKEMNVQTIIAKTNRQNKQAIRAIKKLGFHVTSTNDKETILCRKRNA